MSKKDNNCIPFNRPPREKQISLKDIASAEFSANFSMFLCLSVCQTGAALQSMKSFKSAKSKYSSVSVEFVLLSSVSKQTSLQKSSSYPFRSGITISLISKFEDWRNHKPQHSFDRGGGVSWIWNVEFGIVNRGIYRGMAPKLDPWNALRGR